MHSLHATAELREGGSLPLACPTPRRGWRRPAHEGAGPQPCGRRSCPACGLYLARLLRDALLRDARWDPPVIVLHLTTRRQLSSTEHAAAWLALRRALRRRCGPLEYCSITHHTRGRSDGVRRRHEHVLIKGLPGDRAREVQAVAREVWRERTGAHRVIAEEIVDFERVISYAAAGSGGGQAPPREFRGRTIRSSRGYFRVSPLEQLKAEVRSGRRRAAAERRIRSLLGDVSTYPPRAVRGVVRMLANEELSRSCAPVRVTQCDLSGEPQGDLSGEPRRDSQILEEWPIVHVVDKGGEIAPPHDDDEVLEGNAEIAERHRELDEQPTERLEDERA